MGRHCGRIRAHAAEFWHAENAIVFTDSVGPIEGGAFGGEADSQGDEGEGKKKE